MRIHQHTEWAELTLRVIRARPGETEGISAEKMDTSLGVERTRGRTCATNPV